MRNAVIEQSNLVPSLLLPIMPFFVVDFSELSTDSDKQLIVTVQGGVGSK
jgi:hypothetical protein